MPNKFYSKGENEILPNLRTVVKAALVVLAAIAVSIVFKFLSR